MSSLSRKVYLHLLYVGDGYMWKDQDTIYYNHRSTGDVWMVFNSSNLAPFLRTYYLWR